MQNALKSKQLLSCSQFQITTDLLRNLNKFNLTPITKLVLLELTTHLNEGKNGSVVFPSIGYIAEVLGIGLTATKKAINDLIKEGLIIKSKRDKIKGNYNMYLLTPKVRNLTSEQSENECFKKSESDLFYIEQKRETKKEQTENKTGGNVYSKDDSILKDYAIKHGARNINAYITTLKKTGSANKIIREYKTKSGVPTIEKTKQLIQDNKEYDKTAIFGRDNEVFYNLGVKFGIKK